jgi:hypothetical protein
VPRYDSPAGRSDPWPLHATVTARSGRRRISREPAPARTPPLARRPPYARRPRRSRTAAAGWRRPGRSVRRLPSRRPPHAGRCGVSARRVRARCCSPPIDYHHRMRRGLEGHSQPRIVRVWRSAHQRRAARSAGRSPPFRRLRAARALRASVLGPVYCSQGRHRRVAADCFGRRLGYGRTFPNREGHSPCERSNPLSSQLHQ